MNITRRESRILFLTVIGALSLTTAYGQTGVATALVAGKEGKEVVQKAKDAAVDVLTDARYEGSALAVKMANAAQVAAENVEYSFGKDLDKKFEELNVDEQNALVGLADLTDQIGNLTSGAYDLKDAVSLDVRELFGNLLWKNLDYFVQRVDGLTLIKNDVQYKISILGIGFGTDSEIRRNSIDQVSLDGNAVKFTVEKSAEDRSSIVIASSDLSPFFKSEHAPTRAKLIISSTVSKKGFFGWKEKKYDLPLTIALFPDYSGHILVEYTYTENGWGKPSSGSDIATQSVPTADHNQSGNKHPKSFWLQWSFDVPEDERLVPPFINKALGPMAVFSNGSSFNISPDGKTLNFGVWVWGPPFTEVYGAHIEKLEPKDHSGTMEADLHFYRSTTITVPGTTTFWKVSGKTSSGETIDLVSGGKNPYIKFDGAAKTADSQKITFSSPRPDI